MFILYETSVQDKQLTRTSIIEKYGFNEAAYIGPKFTFSGVIDLLRKDGRFGVIEKETENMIGKELFRISMNSTKHLIIYNEALNTSICVWWKK